MEAGLSETDLLALAAQTDRGACDRLYRQTERLLLSRAPKGMCEDARASVIVDSYMEAVRRFEPSRTPFLAFLVYVMDRRLASHFRRISKPKGAFSAMASADELGASPVDGGGGPSDEASDNEFWGRIEEAIAEFTPKKALRRHLMLLAKGHSAAELAEEQDLNLALLRKQWRRFREWVAENANLEGFL